MKKIPILKIIQKIDGAVVIKAAENFPEYCPGSDIDLLVLSIKDALDTIFQFYRNHFSNYGTLKIEDIHGHCHADFFFEDTLELRIDLIENFNFYQKIVIKNGFTAKVFRDCCQSKSDGGSFFVPSHVDDLTIRYFEYIEYFEQNPDKLKHLEYICDIEDESVKKEFFSNTHRFIWFKRRKWSDYSNYSLEIKSRREAFKIGKTCLKYLLSETLKSWIKKFLSLF